jgi:membrane protein YdbS with pleckstrin-like domain
MIEPLLQAQLDPVARRARRLRLWKALGWYWLFTTFAGAALLVLAGLLLIPIWVTLAAILCAAVIGSWIVRRRVAHWQLDYQQIARQIEQQNPELHALLLTAVEQQPDAATGQLNYLQQRVIQQAVEESHQRKWVEAVSDQELARAEFFSFAALALFAFAMVLTPGIIPERTRASRHFFSATKVEVTPGDASLERGSGLVILARFDGKLPADATLVMKPAGSETSRIPLVKNLEDPVFGGSIPEVQNEFLYSIEYDGQTTREYKISVFDLPRLEKADAHLVYPTYTALPDKTINDTRRVSAVEGSKLDLTLRLNKPVTSAQLVAKDKSQLPLQIEPNAPFATLKDFTLDASKNYELLLRDADGRTNRVPAQFVFEALKNRRPELKLVAPRGDQRVSPLEEIQFSAEAWDDYGIQSIGLDYTIAGKEKQTALLTPENGAKGKLNLAHLIRLEQLGVAPDQLVSYYLWAEDIGPDGQPRRTSSDMFFAEIRPFEEIYRENESAGGGQQGQSGAGNESLKLAELQKQIINATWKLLRQEQDKTLSPQYKKDLPVVLQSQQKAREQAESMKMRANDPRTQVLLKTVEEDMDNAIAELKNASDSIQPLTPAVAAEQAAYQSLLRLSAREYMVSRQRRQQGGQAGGSQGNRQQLDQLELKQEENRYETQRQASRRQSAEQKEQLAFLNRLKELAQRQQDMNERIKELQAALQEAKTETEKEELRRQLKRLREEEREMLADMDELKQQMDKPENQSRMADSRQQMERTREQMQRAAEALENNNPSQALASGARAQKELEQMREDFRKKNSSEFSEEMREMRKEARDLAQQQADIGQKLKETTDNKRKTLAGTPETKDLAERLQSQKAGLTNLLEHVRSVSEKAETSEPLLSKQLYDTFRKNSQANTENSLAFSEELLRRSFVTEAREFEGRARKDLEELKRDVERAAESVLGDEAEALKTARDELEELARQLEKEIAQAEAHPGETNAAAAEIQAAAGSTNSATAQASRPGSNRDSRSDSQSQNSQRDSAQTAQAGQNGQENRPGEQSSRQQEGSQNAQANSNRGDQSGQQASNGNRENQPGGQQANNNRRGNGQRSGRNFFDRGAEDPNGLGGTGPIRGEEYRQWSERLGNIEEMLEQPELRSQVTRIRDRVRNVRSEFKRHAKDPQWDLVRAQILNPLTELRDRLNQELLRHQSSEALVPIDRDPVPSKFSELVRRYYEQLGKSE